jgi:hypothetical protein
MDIEQTIGGIVDQLNKGLAVNVEGLLALQDTVSELLGTLTSEAEDLKAMSAVSTDKQIVIQERLAKIPTIKKRLEALAKKLLDIHNEIQQLRKWKDSRK